MGKEELAREWLKKADADFRIAKHLFTMTWPVSYDGICYHSQQTAEKAFKGFLIFHGKDVPKTHNIMKLCTLCSKIDKTFEKFFDQSENLTEYASTTRYPDDLTDIEECDAKQALEYADQIYKFVVKKIGASTR